MKFEKNKQYIYLTYLVIFIAFIILFIWEYTDIRKSNLQSAQQHQYAVILSHLDSLNSSLTYIERNEKPFLLANDRHSVNEVYKGFEMAKRALGELKTHCSSGLFNCTTLLRVDSIMKEKKLFADTIIYFSVSGSPQKAIDLLLNPKDSLLVYGYQKNYDALVNECFTGSHQLSESQTKTNFSLFIVFVLTIFNTLVVITLTFLRFLRQLKIQENLAIKHQLSADIINQSSDAILMSDTELRLTYVNPATEKLFKKDKMLMLGNHVDEVLRTIDNDNVIERKNSSLHENGHWNGVVKRLDTLGNELDLYMNINAFKNKKGVEVGYFAIATDITELNRNRNVIEALAEELRTVNTDLEKKIREQTEMIVEVFERMDNVFIGTDENFKVIYANKNVINLLDIPETKLLNTNLLTYLLEIIDHGKVKLLNDAFHEQINKSFEFFHPLNGREYEVTIYPALKGISIYFRDFTNEKIAERNVAKTTQLYAFISSINDLLLYANNRQELFEGICSIAVSKGHFIFANLATVDPESYSFKYLAKAGFEDGYLDAVRIIPQSNLPEGLGPSGRAYRSGKYYFCNDIANDPIMAPWRHEALKRNYRSSICLPVLVNGQVDVIMTFYSGTINNFNVEEISLLQRIAQNVSFALKVFENEIEKEKADFEIQKITTAISQSNASIVITDAKGDIEYANPAFETITGYTFDEVKGKNPRILQSGTTPAESFQEMWKQLLLKKPWQGEFCNRKKNGQLYWEYVTISPILNEVGDITNFVAVKEDITEVRKLEEEQLELVELIENSTAYIGRSDLNLNILYMNKAFRKVLEIGENEDTSKMRISDFSTSNFEDDNNLMIAIKNSGKWVGENIFISKSGKHIPVLQVVVLHNDKNGIPIHSSTTAIDLSSVKLKEAQLTIANKELTDLARHLQNISELEKKTIAREIHDELGQYLTAMRMGIAWVLKHMDDNKEDLSVKLNEVSDIVNETIGSFKRIHSSLHPAMLEDVGLHAALEWYISSVTKHVQLEVQFNSNCLKEKFPIKISLPVYRVVQEAVTNVIRYSKATKIEIEVMKSTDEAIDLLIRDNGKGFEVNKVDTALHHGLIGMKERVFGLHGSINIKSTIGKGTEIRAVIPL